MLEHDARVLEHRAELPGLEVLAVLADAIVAVEDRPARRHLHGHGDVEQQRQQQDAADDRGHQIHAALGDARQRQHQVLLDLDAGQAFELLVLGPAFGDVGQIGEDVDVRHGGQILGDRRGQGRGSALGRHDDGPVDAVLARPVRGSGPRCRRTTARRRGMPTSSAIGDHADRPEPEPAIIREPVVNANGVGIVAADEGGESPPRLRWRQCAAECRDRSAGRTRIQQ